MDSPTTRPIRFFHRGALVSVHGAHPTRSVLDWLREDARCVGTKKGCNEGDCSACSVVVGDLTELGSVELVRSRAESSERLPDVPAGAWFACRQQRLVIAFYAGARHLGHRRQRPLHPPCRVVHRTAIDILMQT